jgi:endonuclease/exonuclease/phosphatase (EEP) superfamily protein YafD
LNVGASSNTGKCSRSDSGVSACAREPIRLDHLFISNDVLAFEVREGVGRGSDHRPVIAELGIAHN